VYGSDIVEPLFRGRGLTRNATGSVDALALICRRSAAGEQAAAGPVGRVPIGALLEQGTVTVLTALPARRWAIRHPSRSGDEHPCPACRMPPNAATTADPPRSRPRCRHAQGHPRRLDLQRQITAVLNTHAPQLLQRHGVGPDSAAALLITAGDNPDRMSSEASVAALWGVNPIEASSGKPADAGSTAAATAAPTPPSTASP
jgi:hypothetical protein